jgi:YD repeat-containing protein
MRKKLSILNILITLFFSIMFLFLSCKKDSPGSAPIAPQPSALSSIKYLSKMKGKGYSYTLTYDMNNNLIRIGLYDTLKKVEISHYDIVNDNGKIVKMTNFDKNPQFTNRYEYNSDGLEIKRTMGIWTSSSSNPVVVLDSFIVISYYNTNKQLIIENTYKKMPLDSSNLKQTNQVVSINGNIISSLNTYYGKAGYTVQNEYDDKKNPFPTCFQYHSANNLTKETEAQCPTGCQATISTYTYVYDANGYPTKRTSNRGEVIEFEYN